MVFFNYFIQVELSNKISQIEELSTQLNSQNKEMVCGL
jgi:hypothetical protein